jgi:tyrosine-protein kinase Etk/Wzc
MDKNIDSEGSRSESVQPGSSDGMKSNSQVILDFLAIIAASRKFIIRFVLGSTLIAATVALVSPKWYKSTSSVFPADQTSLFSGLQGLSSIASTLGVGKSLTGLSGKNELDRYMAILKSETALMKVIDRFDLTRVYDITSYPREKTMKELLSNVEFESNEEGDLSITVYDKDPRRAAEMANYFVQVLNEINSGMTAANAHANREFIELRVEKCKEDLRNAEDSLKEYQEQNGVLISPEPNSSSISGIAQLYVMKAKKEIEIGVMERTVSKDNPLLDQLRIELSEIDKSVDKIPSSGIGALRRYREVAIQQKILEFLVPIFEQAKVEEKRATPSVMVLDRGEVSERKAKPKIGLYMLLAFVTSSLLSLFVVFAWEGIRRVRMSAPIRFDQIWSSARSDWFGLRWNRGGK